MYRFETSSRLSTVGRRKSQTLPSNKVRSEISNSGGTDRLLAASTPQAARAELHQHLNDNGVMRMREVSGIALPAGGTVGDLVAALNDPATGIGRFGSYALAADGSLSFTGYGNPAPTMTVLEDRTTQVPSGVSVTELFGLGGGGTSSSSKTIRQPSARRCHTRT